MEYSKNKNEIFFPALLLSTMVGTTSLAISKISEYALEDPLMRESSIKNTIKVVPTIMLSTVLIVDIAELVVEDQN